MNFLIFFILVTRYISVWLPLTEVCGQLNAYVFVILHTWQATSFYIQNLDNEINLDSFSLFYTYIYIYMYIERESRRGLGVSRRRNCQRKKVGEVFQRWFLSKVVEWDWYIHRYRRPLIGRKVQVRYLQWRWTRSLVLINPPDLCLPREWFL